YLLAISIAAESDDPALPVLREEYHRLHNITIQNGWLVMEPWRGGHFNIAVFCIFPGGIIMIASFAVAFYLIIGTFLGIRRSKTISTAYRSFQFKILIATVVPLICVYTPYFCVMYFPFFGLPDYGISPSFSLLVSFFPGWDALAIGGLIKDYREGLLVMLGVKTIK
ncbi:hypothetical protein PFISCL1PPCAC_14022, partial [Pristionchus fissidentatus]